MDDQNELLITREFNASREKLWNAWTNPEEVMKWWGPENFTCPSAKIDLRVGGKYIYCMHGPAGTEFDKDMYSAGNYLEILPMEKLVIEDYFSDKDGNFMEPKEAGMKDDMPPKMTAYIAFEDAGMGKSKLIIEYDKPESGKQFEAMLNSGMKEGWASSLDKLAKVIE